MGLHDLSQGHRKMRKLTRRNNAADVMCLQFDITFETARDKILRIGIKQNR